MLTAILSFCLFIASTKANADNVTGANVLDHGATYVIGNRETDLYLTANKPTYRQVGLRAGNITTEKFDITKFELQCFDALYIGNNTATPTQLSAQEQSKLFWLVSHQATFNSLTINPLSIFPEKNFVLLDPVQGAENEFLIRSYKLSKCLQVQGQNLPATYAPCDPDNKRQRFVGDFLYALEKDVSPFPNVSNQNIDTLF